MFSNRSLRIGLLAVAALMLVAAAASFNPALAMSPHDIGAGMLLLANAPIALPELKSLIEAQGTAWEEFKRTNDERLAKMAKGEAVAELEAKLAKMNDALNENGKSLKDLALKAARPNLGGGEAGEKLAVEVKAWNAKARAQRGANSHVDLSVEQYDEYKRGIASYIRKGLENMPDVERKTINVGTDPQGGYLVGEQMEAGIDRVLRRYSAMRQVGRVIPIGAASYKKLVKVTGTSGATRGNENTAPSNGTSPGWSELEFKPGTHISEQRITAESLEDSVQDVEADLIQEMGIEFAEMEGQDFITGDGVNGPRGLLSYSIVANASYAWNSVGYIASGGASSFASSNPSDALIDLQHSLRRQYRANAVFTMNDATLGAIRKFKDGNGLYMWAPSMLLQGAVGQLLGHSVVTDDFMPDVGSNAYPIAFGDFQRAYYVIDRRGTSVLRDPYTAVPHVKFIGRRRVGGGIANFEAVKLMKIATS
jgi:HK97 family phage major capsid protein